MVPPPQSAARAVPAPAPALPGAVPPAPGVQVEALPPPAPLAQPKPMAERQEVRAALLVPLSGQYASWGQAMANAAQLALFEVADSRFNLIPLDTRGTAEGATNAARMALAQGADVILGPLFSHEVKAAAAAAREQMVPMLAFTTDRSAAGQGVYALGFLPGSQVARVVGHARSQGRERFALLAPSTDYGRAVAEALKAAVLAHGGTLVKSDFYDPTADLTAQVKRFTEFDARSGALARERSKLAGRTDEQSKQALKQLEANTTLGTVPFDTLLLPTEGTQLKTLASLVTYYDIDPQSVKLLGTLLWDDPKLGAEPALVGGWYAAANTQAHAEFESRYTKAFGPMPARVGSIASIAYDATALAAALARQGYADYPTQALTNPNGFAGVDGIFRLLPDGTSERGLSVREVTRTGSQEISPAPVSFGGS